MDHYKSCGCIKSALLTGGEYGDISVKMSMLFFMHKILRHRGVIYKPFGFGLAKSHSTK